MKKIIIALILLMIIVNSPDWLIGILFLAIVLWLYSIWKRTKNNNEDMPLTDTNDSMVVADYSPDTLQIVDKVNFYVNANEYFFHPANIILLNWLDGELVNSLKFPQYFHYYGINPLNELKTILNSDLLELASPTLSLKQLKVTELKELLRNHDLKISGKKQEMIDRIVDNIDPSEYGIHIGDMFTLTNDGEKLVNKYQLLIDFHKDRSFGLELSDVIPHIESSSSSDEIFADLHIEKINQKTSVGYYDMATGHARAASGFLYKIEDYESAIVYGVIEFLMGTSCLTNTDMQSPYYRHHYVHPFHPEQTNINTIINAQIKIGYTNEAVLYIAKSVFHPVDNNLPKPYLYSNVNQFLEMLNYYLNSRVDLAEKHARKLFNKISDKYRHVEFDRYR